MERGEQRAKAGQHAAEAERGACFSELCADAAAKARLAAAKGRNAAERHDELVVRETMLALSRETKNTRVISGCDWGQMSWTERRKRLEDLGLAVDPEAVAAARAKAKAEARAKAKAEADAQAQAAADLHYQRQQRLHLPWVFEVEGPGGRSESISLRFQGHAARGSPVATLGNLRAELFERFGVPPFQQHLALADGEVLQGDDSNPLDAPFLNLEPALEKALPLRLSTRTDPRHAAEKTAAFVDCLTSTPPKLDLALHMLRHPSGVPIDPNQRRQSACTRRGRGVYSQRLIPAAHVCAMGGADDGGRRCGSGGTDRAGADPNLVGDEDVSDGSGMGGADRGTLTGVNPLCHAVKRGSVECVLRLLEARTPCPLRHALPRGRAAGDLPAPKRHFPRLEQGDDILALLAAARQHRSAPLASSPRLRVWRSGWRSASRQRSRRRSRQRSRRRSRRSGGGAGSPQAGGAGSLQRAAADVGPAGAHKSVQHLGRVTCKACQRSSSGTPLTLRHLLSLWSERREAMLALIDAGQRQSAWRS